MIKQLLKNNKIAQRVKAIKNLLLEKLDTLNLKSDRQFGSIDQLLEESKTSNSNINSLQNNVNGLQNSVSALLENGAFLLRFSIDVVNGLQRVIEVSKQQQKTAQQIYQSIGESYKTIEQIYQEFQKIRDEAQRYNQSLMQKLIEVQEALMQKLIEVQEENRAQNFSSLNFSSLMQKLIEVQEENRTQNISTEKILNQVYADIHNQKFKVVTDLPQFKDIEAELMSYLYSYLPHHRAIDIGANRGDVTHRLLQAGYEVYAFEPFQPVLETLKERLGEKLKLHTFPFAVGKVNEERELHLVSDEKLLANPEGQQLYSEADYTLLSSLSKHSLPEGLIFTETVPVSVRNLESLHASSEIPLDIGLVKIDTEGSDLEVILGMGEQRYPVVVAEFWDSKFPFGQFGANNKLEDLVEEMRRREYDWFIVIYKIFLSNDVSYYCNNKFSIENSWGNVFFFQDHQVFTEALKWCSAVMPATYFSNKI